MVVYVEPTDNSLVRLYIIKSNKSEHLHRLIKVDLPHASRACSKAGKI